MLVIEIRIRRWSGIYKDSRSLIAVPLRIYGIFGQPDFGRSNVEIGYKMPTTISSNAQVCISLTSIVFI